MLVSETKGSASIIVMGSTPLKQQAIIISTTFIQRQRYLQQFCWPDTEQQEEGSLEYGLRLKEECKPQCCKLKIVRGWFYSTLNRPVFCLYGLEACLLYYFQNNKFLFSCSNKIEVLQQLKSFCYSFSNKIEFLGVESAQLRLNTPAILKNYYPPIRKLNIIFFSNFVFIILFLNCLLH